MLMVMLHVQIYECRFTMIVQFLVVVCASNAGQFLASCTVAIVL